MQKVSLPTNHNPHISIEAGGDLTLKGHDENQVIIKAEGREDPEIESSPGDVSINHDGNMTIYVPHAATVEVHTVGRSATVKSISGSISIHDTGTDLTLRDVGPCEVHTIGRDLNAKRIHGDLTAHEIGQGAYVRDVDGKFEGGNIGSHLNLRDVSGGVTADVGSHADIALAPVPWQTYDVTCGGNLTCRMAEDASATVVFDAGGGRIDVRTDEINQVFRTNNTTIEVGGGGTQVKLSAGSNIEFRTRGSGGWEGFGAFSMEGDAENPDMDSLHEQIDSLTEQLDSYVDQMTSAALDRSLTPEKRKSIEERIRAAKERIRDRTRRAAERAKDRAKSRGIRGDISINIPGLPPFNAKFNRPGAPQPPAPPAPPSEPVNESERMMILQMLAEKKISLEEAESLLSALEGSGD